MNEQNDETNAHGLQGAEDEIDLLLYHRALKSLIAVELKIGEFQPEHKGKMEFYLVALNEQVKLKKTTPSALLSARARKKPWSNMR